jgi:hypothetical protein
VNGILKARRSVRVPSNNIGYHIRIKSVIFPFFIRVDMCVRFMRHVAETGVGMLEEKITTVTFTSIVKTFLHLVRNDDGIRASENLVY